MTKITLVAHNGVKIVWKSPYFCGLDKSLEVIGEMKHNWSKSPREDLDNLNVSSLSCSAMVILERKVRILANCFVGKIACIVTVSSCI